MKNSGLEFALLPHQHHYLITQKCGYVKWRENAKNLTEPYNGHFENLTEPYSKENKTLQNLTQHLCQVVVTLAPCIFAATSTVFILCLNGTIALFNS